MRQIDQIEFKKSIDKQRLIYKGEWIDILQTTFLFFIFGVMVFYLVLFARNSNLHNNNTIPAWVISALIFLFCLYILYRRIREPHLLEIKTKFNCQTTRQLLLDYFSQQSLKIHTDSSGLLIFHHEQNNFGNNSYGKSIVILMLDNSMYFTILNSGWRLDIPVLTSHISLRHDLKKLLN